MRKKTLLTLGAAFFLFILFSNTSAHSAEGFRVLIQKKNGDRETYFVQSNKEYAQLIQLYGPDPDVLFIEKESTYTIAKVPNDPLYASQDALDIISAEEAWDTSTGSSTIVVAVLDSGVDTSHPDLTQNIWVNTEEVKNNTKDDDGNGFIDDINGWDFVDADNNPKPSFSGTSEAAHHGTVIAGIIGAKGNNAKGISGVAWNVKIMPLRVLNAKGVGSSIEVTEAIEYAVKKGADVINLSFSGSSYSSSLSQAITAARNKGIVVISAAGNDNINLDNSPRYPVCHTGVVGVASVGQDKKKSSFSNYGKNCIDVSAPGESIYSTVSTDSQSVFSSDYVDGWQGTSFAAPHVAGVAALVLSSYPQVTLEQVESILSGNGTTSIQSLNPSYTGQLGGLINAKLSVTQSTLPAVEKGLIYTFPIGNGGPHLRGFSSNGTNNFNDFLEDESFRGGGDIAAGDVNGDGNTEIVFGTGEGTSSRIKVYTTEGTYLKEFLAYSSPQNGIRIAVGDTDGDGVDDIITVRETGATADIRIFDYDGKIRKRFFSYPGSFLGGMTLATGDIDGDKTDEILVGTGKTGLPRVQIFTEDGEKIRDFFAYGLGYRGGVNVDAADVDGDGQIEIITAPLRHGGPHVRIFDTYGNPERDFFAYGEGFHGGVDISTADVTGDGIPEIITGAGQGGGPHVRVFNGKTTHRVLQFFAYAEAFHGGIRVLGVKE